MSALEVSSGERKAGLEDGTWLRLSGVDQAMSNGKAGKFCRVRDIELLFDVGMVGADGFRAQVKNLSDVVDCLAFSEEPEDFKFPLAEIFQNIGHPAQLHNGYLLGDVGAEVDLAF